MKSLPELFAAWAVALWVGGLWAIGYLAAPALFYQLDDRMLAGEVAGHMFAWMAWVGMACGTWLMLFRLGRGGISVLKQPVFWVIVAMLLLTVAQHFGISPIMRELKDQALPKDVMASLFRDRFQTWHGVSSAVYLLQSVLGLLLVARQNTR